MPRTSHIMIRSRPGLLEGEPARQLHALLGRQALVKTMQQFGEASPLTALVPDLNGVGTRTDHQRSRAPNARLADRQFPPMLWRADRS